MPDKARVLTVAEAAQHIIGQSDADGTVEISNTVTEESLDRLNTFSQSHTIADSFVARALLIRSHANICAAWMAEHTGWPVAFCLAVIAHIANNPPAEIGETQWREPDGGRTLN